MTFQKAVVVTILFLTKAISAATFLDILDSTQQTNPTLAHTFLSELSSEQRYQLLEQPLHEHLVQQLNQAMAAGKNSVPHRNLRNKLDNVLLIINYNHPFYGSIQFLQDIYKTYFKNIVFYGEQAHPSVNLFHHNKGFLSHLCIADAMRKYPHFDGYLFLHDDCLLNAWRLETLDLTKLWVPDFNQIPPNPRGNPIDITKGQGAFNWHFWRSNEYGWQQMSNSYFALPDGYKQALAHNWGPSTVVAHYSDISYIPARFKDQFIEVSDIFARHGGFLELALPTMVSCLDAKDNWIYLEGCNRYSMDPTIYFDSVYFNHPVKLSSTQLQDQVGKFFAQKKLELANT